MKELLARMGIKEEDLNKQEIQTLKAWAEALEKNILKVEDIKKYLDKMIVSVEKEISGYDYPKDFSSMLFRRRRLRHMKARLYNYIMLRDFITAPEEARSYIEKHISNFNLEKLNGNKK